MDKQNVTANDVLDALSISLNDNIRPSKNKDKKNNGYFWIFKFIFLIILVLFTAFVFDQVRELGVFIIYSVARSLRSILSGLWILILGLMKELYILYLLYSQYKLFVTSDYYNNLYQKEKKLLKKKEKAADVLDKIFKALAIANIVIFGIFAVLSLIGFVYIICMLFDEMYIISLAFIFLTILGICLLLIKHIKSKFFEDSTGVNGKYIIALFACMVLSVGGFVFETSSFEKSDTLPVGFKIEEKKVIFNINEDQKIKIKSDSKLNNIVLLEDNSLKGQIRVELEYYKTAKVEYISTFNNDDDLRIEFTSDINLEMVDGSDILKLFTSTINNRNIYNYNLFKYPNIRVYANKEDFNRIRIK